MARLLLVRIASALGITSLAFLFVGLIPFLSADPTAGAGLTVKTPTFSVNREFKGDRLPLSSPINSAVSRSFRSERSQTPSEIPVGCDAAFSPISAPHLAYIYGRCAT
jgi:hypothetical protein